LTEAAKTEELNWAELRPQLIKITLEIGPLIVFFIANYRADIFVATAWFMGAMVLSLLLSWLLLHRVALMPLVTGVVVLIFGGLTLWLQDDTFIKMKPTIVNVLFGGTLLGGLIFGQSLLRYVFGDVYKLKDKGWLVLTVRWGVFFFALAILNEIVWRLFDTNTWVAFKVWAIMPLTVIFSMFQLPVLKEYAPDAEPDQAHDVAAE
jgi:intracellular septation protein